jgi:hypothetical protein
VDKLVFDLSPSRRTFQIPDPPDNSVMAVEDKTGRTYYRNDQAGEYWYSEELGSGRGTYPWHELLWQRGPVTAES